MLFVNVQANFEAIFRPLQMRMLQWVKYFPMPRAERFSPLPMPSEKTLPISPEEQDRRNSLEASAPSMRRLDDQHLVATTRISKRSGAERDAFKVVEPDASNAEVSPIDFTAAELAEINAEKTELDPSFDTRERIWEASKAVVETAKGVLNRLVPEQRVGRASSPDSIRKLLLDAAKNSSGVLMEALKMASERLGLVKKETQALDNRAEIVHDRYQTDLEGLYAGGIPEGEETDDARELREAMEAIDSIYNSGQFDAAPDGTK